MLPVDILVCPRIRIDMQVASSTYGSNVIEV